MSDAEKRHMNINRVISLLHDRCAQSLCDGNCDEKPPHQECAGCRAGKALNEAGEILREAL